MKIRIFLAILLAIFFTVGCATESYKDNLTDKELKSAADKNVQLGVGYIKRNNLETALEKLEKAIDQDPDNLDAQVTMAYLMIKLNKLKEAEEHYEIALDIKSNNPQLNNNYGAFLCKVGRKEEALKQFKEAYTNPFYDTPYLALSNAGTCLLEAGDYDESEKMLRKALRTHPKLSDALYSMAELGLKTEKYLMTRAYIQRFHDINKPFAESLWIQVQAERALGAKDHYMKYAKQILDEFPDSDEAGLVGELARDERIKDD